MEARKLARGIWEGSQPATWMCPLERNNKGADGKKRERLIDGRPQGKPPSAWARALGPCAWNKARKVGRDSEEDSRAGLRIAPETSGPCAHSSGALGEVALPDNSWKASIGTPQAGSAAEGRVKGDSRTRRGCGLPEDRMARAIRSTCGLRKLNRHFGKLTDALRGAATGSAGVPCDAEFPSRGVDRPTARRQDLVAAASLAPGDVSPAGGSHRRCLPEIRAPYGGTGDSQAAVSGCPPGLPQVPGGGSS